MSGYRMYRWPLLVDVFSLEGAWGMGDCSLEIQVRVVLFFPFSKVFPLGFFLERFLRRLSHLIHHSPSKRREDNCGDSCFFRWWFPIGAIVIVWF
jgi:hypothetical protein